MGQVLHWLLLWNGRVELDIMNPSMSVDGERESVFMLGKMRRRRTYVPPIDDWACADPCCRKLTENVGSLRDGDRGFSSLGYSYTEWYCCFLNATFRGRLLPACKTIKKLRWMFVGLRSIGSSFGYCRLIAVLTSFESSSFTDPKAGTGNLQET